MSALCRYCNKKVETKGAHVCNYCWDTSIRIVALLIHPRGRERVRKLLAKYDSGELT